MKEEKIQAVRKYLDARFPDYSEDVRTALFRGIEKDAQKGITFTLEDNSENFLQGDCFLDWALGHPKWIEGRAWELDFRERQRKRLSKLSDIIPGVPDEVQPARPGDIPEFFYRGTDKVGDIMHKEVNRRKLRETLAGKTLLDIGAGQFPSGLVEVARRLGVKNYIAVEPCFHEEIVESISPDGGIFNYNSVERIHVSKADMRTFMRALPSECKDLSVLFSGIDKWILNTIWARDKEDLENAKKSQDYLSDFWNETRRVLAPGERVVTYASFVPGENGFKIVYEGEAHEGPVLIWERTVAKQD